MLYLGVAAFCALLAIFCGAVKYKLASIIFGFAAFVSFIAFIRNPSFPTPTLPDNIPLPGGGK